jgi:single-stranded DNA-binding protein
VELRRSEGGKDWCRLSVGVGEGDEVTWVSVSVFQERTRELAGLAKGAEVYVEGRLSLNAWTGKDGQQRTGLSVTAWQMIALGQIGRRKPKVQSRDEYERPRDEQDAVPFDDPLRL